MLPTGEGKCHRGLGGGLVYYGQCEAATDAAQPLTPA